MQKEDLVIERRLQQGQPWCQVSIYRKKLIIIIVNSPHNNLYNYEIGCSWIVVHVWESNTYIEEVSHQSSLTNCIIFYLWGKLEHVRSHPHKTTKSFGLPLIGATSFLLLDSCPIGVSADLCPAGAPWLREWSTKFITYNTIH